MRQMKRPAGQGRAADEIQANRQSTATITPLQPHAGDHDAAIDIEGFKPLLPEDWYEARYTGHATALVFKAPKIFLQFEISQFGDHHGIAVFRAFRVRRLKGRPGPDGGFVLHAGGELYATLVRLLDVRCRADRVTLRPLRSMLFKVRMRTVTTDYKQRPIPEHNRYSVVDEIEQCK